MTRPLPPGRGVIGGARVTPRVLFLPADARGLGHFSRACKLARALGRRGRSVVAAGQPHGRHLVPSGCEFVLVPERERVLPFRIPEGGGPPTGEPPADVLARRRAFFHDLVGRIAPDVIVTDQYPTGVCGELHDILARSRARKLIVFRPVPGLDGARGVEAIGAAELGRLYDLILIAADRRTSLVEEDLGLGDRERRQCRYLGYVSRTVGADRVEAARRARGLDAGDRWIVCSVGSGFYHQSLIADVRQLARELAGVHVDLVPGPASPGAAAGPAARAGAAGRVRLGSLDPDLHVMHAAADLVICHGGYNTVTEAMEGGAALVIDVRNDVHRERARHAARLQAHYPLACAEDADELARLARALILDPPARRSIRARATLDFDGGPAFARLIAELA